MANKELRTQTKETPKPYKVEVDIQFSKYYIPKVIFNRMLEHQKAQGNDKNAEVFKINIDSDKNQKGFDWEETAEGFDAWEKCIIAYKHEEFIYNQITDPKSIYYIDIDVCINNLKNYSYIDLSKIPKAILYHRMTCSIIQNEFNELCPEDCLKNIDSFIWNDTQDGVAFWGSVLMSENYDLYFTEYPERKIQFEENSSLRDTLNDLMSMLTESYKIHKIKDVKESSDIESGFVSDISEVDALEKRVEKIRINIDKDDEPYINVCINSKDYERYIAGDSSIKTSKWIHFVKK